MERLKIILFLLLLMFFMSALTSVASAATVAYWRFEPDDPGLSKTPANNVAMPHTNNGTTWVNAKAAHDWSDNGNHLSCYSNFNGLRWSSNIPETVVPLTLEDNELGAQNSLGTSDAGTFSFLSQPSGLDIGDTGNWTPEQWTIEASFNALTTSGGYRTIVGRDASELSWDETPGHLNNVGAFYLTVRPANQLATEFTDMNGVNHVIESVDGIITEGRWYHTVVVSDGETYSLYLEDVAADTGFQLVGQLDLTASSSDTRLAHGDVNGTWVSAATSWNAGNFSVGRAVYTASKVDYWYGYIDEIRISDTALSPSQFLFQEHATEPFPEDEGAYGPTDVNLHWTPAATSVQYDVYYGTDVNAVNDADHDSNEYMDTIDTNSYWVYDTNRGTTYYWRIDTVESGGAPTHKGQVWSFLSMPVKAWNLYPYDDKTHVLLDAELSWNAGADSNASNVYFGDTSGSLNLEETIAHTAEPNYVFSLSDVTLTTIEKGEDYYWRIDQVPEGGGADITGDEMHITTIPDLPVIPNLVGWWKFDEGLDNVIDSSGHDLHGTAFGGARPATGYEGSGILLDGDDDYVSLPIGTDLSGLTNSTFCAWVNFDDAGLWWQRIFDFGNNTNVNMFLTPRGGPPALRFAITTTGAGGEDQTDSTAGVLPTGWHHVAVVIDQSYTLATIYLDLAPVGSGFTDTYPQNLGVTTNNWLGRSQYAADAYFSGVLDDFRIYDYALTQDDLRRELAPREASLPDPPNLGTRVDRYPVLSWLPGRYAADVNGHQLYYSTDINDVNDPCNRAGAPIVLTDPCFAIPEPCAPFVSNKIIYWVVDEVNDNHLDKKWPGNLWQFTIRDYAFVDEFELYSDTGWVNPHDLPDPPPPGTLRSVWIDGHDAYEPDVTVGSSGSFVQLSTDPCDCYPVYRPCEHYIADENGIYLSEGHSMKFYYDNDGTVEWQDILYYQEYDIYTPSPNPYLSEAYAAINDDNQPDPELDSLDSLPDWSGYKVLRIPFYGDPDNDEEGMYVRLEDGDGTIVTIKHPNPLTLKKPWWTDWDIALSEFTAINGGLDLSNIGKIYLGFGDPCNPQAGGSGMVFFDDIELLTKGVCVDANCDLNNDCVADNADLELLTMGIPWYGVKPVSDPLAGYTPLIRLEASAISQALGTQVNSWTNTGSKGGVFTDFNVPDGEAPVLEMVEGKKAVTFADVNDLLVWSEDAPGGITGANDFTVVIEAFNIDVTEEEWILAWSKRGTPDATFAAFGYGTHVDWGAAAHYGTGPDMGFGPLGAPPAHTWHTIVYTYDGNDQNPATVDSNAEHIIVDGQIYNAETKLLNIDPNQPVVIGTAYQTATDGRIKDYWEPIWAITDWNLRYIGSVASIKVYDESVSAMELALWMGNPADFDHDNRIDFRDIAVLGKHWLEEGTTFGE